MFKSLRFRVLWRNLILLMTLIIILTTLIYNQESKNLIERAKSNSQLLTDIYSEKIGSTIMQHVNHLEFLAETKNTKQLNMDHIFEMLNYMRISENSLFVDTFFIEVNGNYYDPDGPLGSVADRDYFQQLIEEQPRHIISEAIISKSIDVPIILLVVPVLDETDTLIGAVAGSIKLTTLSGELVTIKYPGESYGWIIENSGRVIAHHDPDIQMNINVLTADDNDYPGLSTLGESMIVSDHGFGEYYDAIQEEDKILTYSSIPNTPGWKLAITTLSADIFTPLQELLKVILSVSSITIVLSIVFSFLFSKKVVQPILVLTDAVIESEKRNFSEITILTEYDEMSHLVTAYNKMTVSLKNYTSNLEQMVDERTKELEKLNRQLDAHNQELYSIATTDELTGLLSRSHVFEQLEAALQDVEMGIINCFSILFIDIDNFKYYNDTFGHAVGDRILMHFSDLLKNTFRDSDIIGRYGGDEFIVILPNTDADKSKKVSGKFQSIMNDLDGYKDLVTDWLEQEVVIPNHKKFNVSIGISILDNLSKLSLEELIKEADSNMYKEKKNKKRN